MDEAKFTIPSLLLEGSHTGNLFMVGQYVQPYPTDNIITTLQQKGTNQKGYILIITHY